MYNAFLLAFLVTSLVMCDAGCVKKQKKTKESSLLEEAEDKGEYIYENITDSIYLARCDKLTFKALLSVYTEQDISKHEKNGKWERDVLPCYPENSKSSISFDGILSVLHHIVSTEDKEMLERLVRYSEEHSWKVGEGPSEYTNISILAPMMYSIQKRMALISMDELLSGFRGHLLASYIWLNLRLNGSVSEVEAATIERLVEASPADPMYLALYHRLKDGNQDEALYNLLTSDEFEYDTILQRDGVFGWGSAPASIYYLITLSIIEGK